MSRRWRRSTVIAALVATVGGVVAISWTSFEPAAEPAVVSSAVPISRADRAPDGISLKLSPRPQPERAPEHVVVDVARVEAALARLEASTAKITAEQVAAEQRKMLEAKARFEAIKIAEPKTRKLTDANGTRWIELQHESGELRYQLDPDEDAADVVQTP